jgi:DNA-binding LytR/AlgR family response regulator
MGVTYRILWVEDYEDIVIDDTPKIKNILKKLSYRCEIDHCDDYDEFIADYIEGANENTFLKYDLVLMDYNMTDINKKERNGVTLIKLLIDKGLCSDIIFYSSKCNLVRKDFKQNELDGVYLSYKNERFYSIVESVVKKTLRREKTITGIRGTLMDRTSYFDFVMQKAIKYFDQKFLPGEKTKFIKDHVKELLDIQKFNYFIIGYKTAEKANSELCFISRHHSNMLPSMKKYKLLEGILKKFNYSGRFYSKKFADDYNKKIFKFRHDLAHKKLTYTLDYEGVILHDECDINCSTCKIIEMNKVDGLRNRLVSYDSFFESLDNDIDKLIELERRNQRTA